MEAEPATHALGPLVGTAAPNSSFLGHWRRDYADYRPEKWDYNSCERSYVLAQRHPGLVQLQRHLGPMPTAPAQYARFVERAHVLHVTGMFNAPWRQEAVRATGLLETIVARVMRRVNRSTELNAQQRACAQLVEQL